MSSVRVVEAPRPDVNNPTMPVKKIIAVLGNVGVLEAKEIAAVRPIFSGRRP